MSEKARPRIVITHACFAETAAALASVGEVVSPGAAGAFSGAQLRGHAADAEAILAFMPDSVDAAFLGACPRLRIIAGALKGYDNFDAEACARHGVWLTIVPELLTVPTAELAMGLAIALARQLRAGDTLVRSGDFRGWTPRFYGTGFADATVGLLGMGAIGQAIAARLQGFGCDLLYHDPRRLAEDAEQRLRVRSVDRDELLARSDFVFLAVGLNPQTRHLVDAGTLARMRAGAYLINPGRGSVVDEEAVVDALDRRQLAGYAADVFAMEDRALADRPRTIPPRLRRHPNTFFTPHIGSAVGDVRRAIELRAAANIRQALAGERPRDAVNQPR